MRIPGEFGARTPLESRVIEQRKSTLAYDVLKPFLLGLLTAAGAMAFTFSAFWFIKALGRHIWYVVVVVFSIGQLIWAVSIGRKYDGAWNLTTLCFGAGLCIFSCAGGIVLDLLITHYWTEMIKAFLPLTGAAVLVATMTLANVLEAILVSPHLEQALAIVLGGHDGKYTGPWWMRLVLQRRRADPLPRPLMNKGRPAQPDISRAQVTPDELSEIEMFLRLVIDKKTLSRDTLKDELLINGKKLTKPGWYRCIAILEEMDYIEKTSSGYKWTNGNTVQSALDNIG